MKEEKSYYEKTSYLRVDSDVQTHEFPEVFVCKSELVCVVCAVIESAITIWKLSIVSIFIVEDYRSNS